MSFCTSPRTQFLQPSWKRVLPSIQLLLSYFQSRARARPALEDVHLFFAYKEDQKYIFKVSEAPDGAPGVSDPLVVPPRSGHGSRKKQKEGNRPPRAVYPSLPGQISFRPNQNAPASKPSFFFFFFLLL